MKIKNQYLVGDERTLHGDCANTGNSITMATEATNKLRVNLL